jgi:glycosyltransferase involved in cell wall biosynthesis
MKILYISAEHVSGTLSLFKEEHLRRGDECRFVTFWHSRWDFPDDICLNLPFMPNRAWIRGMRHVTNSISGGGTDRSPDSAAAFWNPGWIGRSMHALRDAYLWPKIKRAIDENGLDSFDIIHLDGGLDFTRDVRFASDAFRRGKHIVAYYHGSDMRTRGIVRPVDEIAGLRLTCEWDLIELDSRLRYLYLPFKVAEISEKEYRFHTPIRIAHASRNPFKGTEFVQQAVAALATRYPVELVLLRDMSHSEALRRKAECDIFVDQLTNAGGWGYGMSSVEAFAMGMPVVTNIPPPMLGRIRDHPFVLADSDTVYAALEELIQDEHRCRQLAAQGRQWVKARHDVQSVGDQLYEYYREAGWL